MPDHKRREPGSDAAREQALSEVFDLSMVRAVKPSASHSEVPSQVAERAAHPHSAADKSSALHAISSSRVDSEPDAAPLKQTAQMQNAQLDPRAQSISKEAEARVSGSGNAVAPSARASSSDANADADAGIHIAVMRAMVHAVKPSASDGEVRQIF